MAKTKLHLGSENYLYYENGQHVKVRGYPVKRWDGDNKRWSLSTGSEVKEFKGKNILDLEKILGYVEFGFYKRKLRLPIFNSIKNNLIFKYSYYIMLLYLKNNNIAMYLNLYNPHWEKDFYYDIKFKRDFYYETINQLNNRFIINISGLRRVGKTTVLKQVIDFLVKEKNTNRKNIFFYSFDNLGNIEEQINEYKSLVNIDFFKEKVYIFFDEIQKVKDWQSKIKIYYDLYPNIKFILTGSSSIYLQKRESLAGRMYEYRMKTLSFQEYLRYKDIDYYLEEKNIYKEKIELEFERYIFRQFIDIIDSDKNEVIKYTDSLANKIIKEDITYYFKIEYPDILISIFKIIRNNPGMLLDYKNFSNDLDIDQRTLEKYIFFLEEANLIKKIYNFSKNTIKSERKLKKVYLNSCSFSPIDKINGELFENYIQNTFDYEYFWRLTDKKVDFVEINNNNEIIAIEVKYKDKIKKNDVRGIKSFSNKYVVKEKIIINKTGGENIDDINVVSYY